MFVTAYSKRTGKKVPYEVPEHWVDHPVLGADLTRSPGAAASAAARQAKARAAEDPVPTTTDAPAVGDDKKE